MAAGAKMAPGIVTTFGEVLVDFVPTDPRLSVSEARAFKKAAGGAPANVAVGVCRLGGRAAFIGKVGKDAFGEMLKKVLESEGVDVRGVVLDSAARTALAFVTQREHDGERDFMFYRNPSADMLMLPSELDEGLVRGSTIFHYGSISLISEHSRSTHYAAMKLAKDSNCLLSYDPNVRLALWPSPEAARESIMSIWDQADIVKLNHEEVKFLTNCRNDEKLDKTVREELWHPNMKLLLVTCGPDGCRYYSPTFQGRVESFPVHVVDTTGAGDAFMAGLLTQLVENKELLRNETMLQSALRFACACGAITTTGHGAIPWLPNTSAVMNLINGTPHHQRNVATTANRTPHATA